MKLSTLTKPLVTALSLALSTSLLTGCGGGSNNDEPNTPMSASLPAGLTITMVDSTGPYYYAYNTDSDELTDLNNLADSSGDSAIQKLRISDVSTLGAFFDWPDFRMVNDAEKLDGKYLLMKPDYVSGTEISSEEFVQLVHFHSDDLAAHSADEFANPEEGSGKYLGLQRLNAHVTAQSELETEIEEVLPAGQTLCRAYVDPYLKFEMEQEHAEEAEVEETTEEEHDHGALTHFALTESGRMYFYQEGENGLDSLQGFVALDEVTSIENCARTTIARTSEDGVLVFIPDTQKLYLVDSHGGDYHQHSTWNITDILPAGEHADMVAILGAGSAHEHDHEEEYDQEGEEVTE